MNYECIEEAYTLITSYGHMGMPIVTYYEEGSIDIKSQNKS